MKKSATIATFIICIATAIWVGCNNGGEKKEHIETADTANIITEPNTQRVTDTIVRSIPDSVLIVKKVVDSMNALLKECAALIVKVDKDMTSNNDPAVELVLQKKKATLLDRNDEISIVRDQFIANSLVKAIRNLRSVVAKLKENQQKLADMADKLDRLISILNVVDSAIMMGVQTGAIKAPIPPPPAS